MGIVASVTAIFIQAISWIMLVVGLLIIGFDFEQARDAIADNSDWAPTKLELGLALASIALFVQAVNFAVRWRVAVRKRPKLNARATMDEYGLYWFDIHNNGARAEVAARAIIRLDAPFNEVVEQTETSIKETYRMSWDEASPNSWEKRYRRLIWHDDESAAAMSINKGDVRRMRLGAKEISTLIVGHSHKFNFLDQHKNANFRETATYLGDHENFLVELILTCNPESKHGTDVFIFCLTDDGIEEIKPSMLSRLFGRQKPVLAKRP